MAMALPPASSLSSLPPPKMKSRLMLSSAICRPTCGPESQLFADVKKNLTYLGLFLLPSPPLSYLTPYLRWYVVLQSCHM